MGCLFKNYDIHVGIHMMRLNNFKTTLITTALTSSLIFAQSSSSESSSSEEEYSGPVRCDIVTQEDECIDLNASKDLNYRLPRNVTRIAENGLNICMPPDLSFPDPIDVVFVVDQSGSMATRDQEFETPLAVLRAIDSLKAQAPKTNVGFVGFAGGVCDGTQSETKMGTGPRRDNKLDTRVEPGPLTSDTHYEKLVTQTSYSADDYWYGCGPDSDHAYETWYSTAIELAAEWLDDLGSKSNGKKVIIFFTDGFPNGESDSTFNTFSDGKDSTNFPVLFPISLLTDSVHTTLQNLSDATGGTGFNIQKASQIDYAMQKIIDESLVKREPNLTTLTNETNSREIESTQYTVLDEDEKLYQIIGDLLALDSAENTITVSVHSDNDASYKFSKEFSLDVSGGSINELGTHTLNNSIFEARCYKTAQLSATDEDGEELGIFKESDTSFGITLETDSRGFEPAVALTSAADTETIVLEIEGDQFENNTISASISKTATDDNDVLEGPLGEAFTAYWENPNDPRENASIKINTAQPKPPTTLTKKFRETIVAGALNQDEVSFNTIENITTYNEDGEVIGSKSVEFGQTWIEPVQLTDAYTIDPEYPCNSFTQDTHSPVEYPSGCLASMAVVTNISSGPYTAKIHVFDNMGQYVTQWSQSFGKCGELENSARQEQTGISGMILNDLIWNLKDSEGRTAATGVYIWKIALSFENGTKSAFTRDMGVLRPEIETCTY